MRTRAALAALICLAAVLSLQAAAWAAPTPPPALKQKLLSDGKAFLQDSERAGDCSSIPCEIKWFGISGHAALLVASDERRLAPYAPGSACKADVLGIAADSAKVGRVEIGLAEGLRHPIQRKLEALLGELRAAEHSLSHIESSSQCPAASPTSS
jgi:hypothetical protein